MYLIFKGYALGRNETQPRLKVYRPTNSSQNSRVQLTIQSAGWNMQTSRLRPTAVKNHFKLKHVFCIITDWLGLLDIFWSKTSQFTNYFYFLSTDITSWGNKISGFLIPMKIHGSHINLTSTDGFILVLARWCTVMDRKTYELQAISFVMIASREIIKTIKIFRSTFHCLLSTSCSKSYIVF